MIKCDAYKQNATHRSDNESFSDATVKGVTLSDAPIEFSDADTSERYLKQTSKYVFQDKKNFQ